MRKPVPGWRSNSRGVAGLPSSSWPAGAIATIASYWIASVGVSVCHVSLRAMFTCIDALVAPYRIR
jgi:hypothetical protein